MSTIYQFLANFHIGARSNLYKVTIDLLPEKLAFTCKTAQLPGKNISPIEVKYLNNTVKVGGDPTYDDWTITILNDEDFIIRNSISDWMETIKMNGIAVGAPTMLAYMRTATVEHIRRDGAVNENARFKLFNLWPSTMDPIDLGFDNSDTIIESGVTFSYSHWEKL